MKKNITIYLLLLAAIFFACSEDKGNYDYAPANNLKIKGIPTDTAVQSYEVLKLVPEFERSLLPSEEGLVYSWTIEGEEVATTRDLEYTIPGSLNVGKHDCRYIVTDSKNDMKYFYSFNISVTSPFSWGYYFLCEGANKESILSYFSAKEGTTDCIHVDNIGGYSLGSEPKAIIEQFGNISSLGDYYYTFYVISAKGETPTIITDNGAFMPTGLITNSSFMFEGDSYNPTDGVMMATGTPYFISNEKIYSYNSGLLYRPAQHDKEYKWSHPASYYGYVFVFDELSKKYYVLKKQINDPEQGLVSDSYALDRVIEIKEQPSYEGQTLITQSVGMDADAHVLSLALAESGKINLVSLQYIDFRAAKDEDPEIKEQGILKTSESLSLAGADANTRGILVGQDWYFVVGSKVYTSPVLKPQLADLTTLPDDLGVPVAVAVSSKETHLIIATYDAGSSHENKGSFALVDLTTKEVKVHRNVMGKCVVAKGYDANPWF